MDSQRFQEIFYAARLLTPGVSVSARIPLAQAQKETQLGTTGVGVSYNNLFGMKQPVLRKTLSLGASSSGFSTFSSHLQSIRDYLLFLHDLGLTDDGKLMAYISAGKYAPGNKTYVPTLNKIIEGQAPQLINPLRLYAKAGGIVLGGVATLTIAAKFIK